jgi:hypothetical protein
MTLNLSAQHAKKEFSLLGVDDSLNYRLVIDQNFSNETATFSSQGHNVTIFGVQDLLVFKVHEAAFLELQFRVRGGTGVKVRRTVLICISSGEIYRAFDITSVVESRLDKVYNKQADSLKLFDEKEDYNIKISIIKDEARYKAVLFESTRVESKYDPSKNVLFEQSYTLDFDLRGHFFHNSMKTINKSYKVYSINDHKTVDRFISGEFPSIQLHQRIYIFINKKWCLDNGHDFLTFFE